MGEISQNGPIEQLVRLYRVVLESPSFDHYRKYEEQIDNLYDHLRQLSLTEYDLSLLSEVQVLHEELTLVILNETKELKEEMNLFEKKKRISDHYGRHSNNYDVGAFFVDFKK